MPRLFHFSRSLKHMCGFQFWLTLSQPPRALFGLNNLYVVDLHSEPSLQLLPHNAVLLKALLTNCQFGLVFASSHRNSVCRCWPRFCHGTSILWLHNAVFFSSSYSRNPNFPVSSPFLPIVPGFSFSTVLLTSPTQSQTFSTCSPNHTDLAFPICL